MKYTAIQSLFDLEVGKVYFKDGSSYLVEEKDSDSILFKVDGQFEERLYLNRETNESYLDSFMQQDGEQNIFFKLHRDVE